MLMPCLPAAAAQETASNRFDPATVMPADTGVYLELGSPGAQIEKILEMIEGTPLEDSLTEMLSQNDQEGQNQSPILKGLLNPSMMAEFKKIDGAAVGLISYKEDIPDFVAVVSPGESDALKGLLLAGLSIAGTPVESPDNIQIWSIEEEICVAYDGGKFIAANSPEILQRAISLQNKTSSEASLAAVPLFQKTSRQIRSANVVTIWIDGRESYRQVCRILEDEGDSEAMAIIDTTLDLNHVDRLLVQLSLQDSGIALDADLLLNEAHKCHAYNILKTPALSKEGLSMLPSDTIALFSVSLGDADSASSRKAQSTLKQITGLDIGREIFANIEQINLFAVDSRNISDLETQPAAAVAVAITSKDGKSTGQLLGTLLQTATKVMETVEESNDPTTITEQGQYAFSVNGKTLNLYLDQKENVTVLSPSKQIISKCFTACNNKTQRAEEGALKPVFDNMPKVPNKLVVLNAAGLIRAMEKTDVVKNIPFDMDSEKFEDFTKELQGTNLCVRVLEKPNQCNVNISLDGIASLKSLFPKTAKVETDRQQGDAGVAMN